MTPLTIVCLKSVTHEMLMIFELCNLVILKIQDELSHKIACLLPMFFITHNISLVMHTNFYLHYQF